MWFVLFLIDMDEKIWMCLALHSEKTYSWLVKNVFPYGYEILEFTVYMLWVSFTLVQFSRVLVYGNINYDHNKYETALGKYKIVPLVKLNHNT